MDHPFGFLIDAPVTLAQDKSSWVQLAKTGVFKDPRYGTFKITPREFSKWIANFQGLVLDRGRLGLPADVDHSPEKKGETEAVGWVKQLEVRADGKELWGYVEWNDLGQELIANKRYAYVSPSYTHDFKDESGKSHGTALLGFALTNRPFLQMATVNLSAFTFAANDGDADDGGAPQSKGGVEDLDYSDMDAAGVGAGDAEILDISDAARKKHAVVVKKVDGKTKHMFPIPPGDKVHAAAALRLLPRAIAAGHISPSEAAAIRSRAHGVLGTDGKQHESYSHRQMDLTTVLTTLGVTLDDLGVAKDADEATVLTALATHQKKQVTPQVPEGHVVLSADQVQQLTSQAAAGAAAAEELRVNKFETAFLSAQEAGKVTLSQKDTFRNMYDIPGNADNTLKVLDELQPVINMTPGGHGLEPADLTPEVATLAAAYSDSVTPRPVDQEGLKLLAAAEALERTRNIPFEQALALAEQGVTV